MWFSSWQNIHTDTHFLSPHLPIKRYYSLDFTKWFRLDFAAVTTPTFSWLKTERVHFLKSEAKLSAGPGTSPGVSTVKTDGSSIIQYLRPLCPFQSILQGRRMLKGLTQTINVLNSEMTWLPCIPNPPARTHHQPLPNYKKPGNVIFLWA